MTGSEIGSSRICVVDDDKDTGDLLKEILERMGHRVEAFTDATMALDHLASAEVDVFLTDLSMGPLSGIDVCERVLGTRPGVPVIVITGQGSMETAIAAMRAGAFDFLTKPVAAKLLGLAVDRASHHRHLSEEARRLRHVVATGGKPSSFVGSSSAMQKVFDLIARVAPSDASVLLSGETGTGKELAARAIHEQSARQKGPFVAVNCAAIPPHLLESELFGHARGAFTDAKSARTGLFVDATGGTLFIDEIGELPLEMQPKLLRALQERKVRPIGSNTEIPFETRIIAATNRDLEQEIAEKRFREDLYYRINVVSISLPPLRERGGDVLTLAHHFLARAAATERRGEPLSLSEPAAQRLLTYPWPGNVRELENCIERVVALARTSTVLDEDLPDILRTYRAEPFTISADDPDKLVPMDVIAERYVRRVLGILRGNKTRAAQMLGFDRRTLYRKVERWGIR